MLSILITHYNRPDALETCINSIRDFEFEMDYEIVVSDDCSDSINVKKVKHLDIDTLVTSERNMGLANNINKGINACKGSYILYIQEDYIIDSHFQPALKEGIELLNSNTLDMIRYRANYTFKKLLPCSNLIYKIPKFSFSNFYLNTFQYSDNPFLTTVKFYREFGYYLENTSGPYGETEFAIRIMKSRARIGITKQNYFHSIDVPSTMEASYKKRLNKPKKKIRKFARALRQHLEWILYTPKKRKLYTYKNKRI